MTTILSWLSPLVMESRRTQAILIGGTVAFLLYSLTKKRYKYPPGPRGLPLIGNLLALRNASLHDKLSEWTEAYGPIVTVHMGPMRVIFLNHLDVIREAFTKKSVDFAGRPQLTSAQLLTAGGKDIVLTDYGPSWQLHRRLALKALGSYMKGSNLDDTMQDVLKTIFQEMRKENGPFDVHSYVGLIVFNILSKVCFDEKFGKHDKEFRSLCELIDKGIKERGNGFLEDVFPFLTRWPTKKFRNFFKLFDEITEFIYLRIDRHKKTFSPDIKRDFTDAMFLAQKELEAEENPDLLAEITDTHFVMTIIDIFLAGIDTSRHTLCWTILYVATHPDVQAKIHEEVDSVLGARVTPLMSDRANLPYTEAVLCESMRLATVNPLGIPRTTTCDTSIGDYSLPKGTVVMANLHAVHHDPKLWEEPMSFKPERFLDSSGKLKPRLDGWMPFSVGKRSCLAETLARPNLHVILAGLYRNFEIRMPKGVTADFTPKEDAFAYISKTFDIVIKDRFA